MLCASQVCERDRQNMSSKARLNTRTRIRLPIEDCAWLDFGYVYGLEALSCLHMRLASLS